MNDNKEFQHSVDKATAKAVGQLFKNMQMAALKVEAAAKKECPVDTGILRASINSSCKFEDGEIVGRIGSMLEYAPYVHQGTGIYAKDGNGRKTEWTYVASSGKYKGGHKTRGQEPNPFLERARDKEKNNISKILAKGTGNA